jgi:hypothetical protein
MVGNKKIEKWLHDKFKHLHVRNEWFKPGEDLLQYIDSLEYGTEFERELEGFVRVP